MTTETLQNNNKIYKEYINKYEPNEKCPYPPEYTGNCITLHNLTHCDSLNGYGSMLPESCFYKDIYQKQFYEKNVPSYVSIDCKNSIRKLWCSVWGLPCIRHTVYEKKISP